MKYIPTVDGLLPRNCSIGPTDHEGFYTTHDLQRSQVTIMHVNARDEPHDSSSICTSLRHSTLTYSVCTQESRAAMQRYQSAPKTNISSHVVGKYHPDGLDPNLFHHFLLSQLTQDRPGWYSKPNVVCILLRSVQMGLL